jgi:hypothetical protein
MGDAVEFRAEYDSTFDHATGVVTHVRAVARTTARNTGGRASAARRAARHFAGQGPTSHQFTDSGGGDPLPWTTREESASLTLQGTPRRVFTPNLPWDAWSAVQQLRRLRGAVEALACTVGEGAPLCSKFVVGGSRFPPSPRHARDAPLPSPPPSPVLNTCRSMPWPRNRCGSMDPVGTACSLDRGPWR